METIFAFFMISFWTRILNFSISRILVVNSDLLFEICSFLRFSVSDALVEHENPYDSGHPNLAKSLQTTEMLQISRERPCLGKIRWRTRWWCLNRAVVLVPTSKREISILSGFKIHGKSLFSGQLGLRIITNDLLGANGLIKNTIATNSSVLKAKIH